ncbi:MAG: cell wall hydrolase [Halopseudomonas aestusnigri]
MGDFLGTEIFDYSLKICCPNRKDDLHFDLNVPFLRIGSGFGNCVVLDEDGIIENHCVIDILPDGVEISPLGGYLLDALGDRIDDRIQVPFGKPFSLGESGIKLSFYLKKTEDAEAKNFLLKLPLSQIMIPLYSFFSALGSLIKKRGVYSKITVAFMIIMGTGFTIVQGNTRPEDHRDFHPITKQSKVMLKEQSAASLFSVKPSLEVHDGTSPTIYTTGLTGLTLENGMSDRDKISKSTKQQGTEQALQMALEGLGGNLELVEFKKGVARLKGQLSSRNEMQKIETALLADVPNLIKIDTIGVTLKDGPQKMEEGLTPENIVAVWAGVEPYIEMKNGFRYWVGSVIGNGGTVESIQLDRVLISKNSDWQEIKLDVSRTSEIESSSNLSELEGSEGLGWYNLGAGEDHRNTTFPTIMSGLTSDSTGNESLSESVYCLAQNIYFEARNEPVSGRKAVAHVVMNRVASSRFPSTVCDVVQQGGRAKKYKCQFTWWCDGISDEVKNVRAWGEAEKLAQEVFTGKYEDVTFGSLWYHADYVSPTWQHDFDRGPKIGQHIFYKEKNKS